MKKIICALILISLVICVSSCSGSGVEIPDGMQLVSTGDVAYNFFVPGGWVPTENNGIFGAYYSNSDKSNMTVSSLYPTDELMSIGDYWKALEASYSETFKNFEIIEAPENNETNIIFGERGAFKYVFSADIDGESYKMMQILTVDGSLFYTFTYTAKADLYESHLADVEKAVTEFEFK
jgi:hypothetical protein